MKDSEHAKAWSEETRRDRRFLEGFTFVELLVAMAIFAVTITAAVIAYQSISSRADWTSGAIDVTLASGVTDNFYGMTNGVLAVNMAPSLGELARAEDMRESLQDDLNASVAAFCLARNGLSTNRPSTINLGPNFNVRTNISPTAFRALVDPSSSVFSDYSGAASNLTNTSLFILQASTNETVARVRAIYESDFTQASDPPGTYASVRRYEQGVLTSFFHVFYAGTNTHNFLPPVVFFDRSVRPASGNAVVDRYLQAANMPFYFLWWPDPATPRFWDAITPNTGGAQPRAGYQQMADRTAYFFVIPAIPAL